MFYLKWVNHKLLTGSIIYAATGSAVLTVIAAAGSIFPDAIEGFPNGENDIEWRKNHRRLSHWFLPYFLICLASYSVASFNGYLNLTSKEVVLLLKTHNISVIVVSLSLAYFMIGALLHIAQDAICGKVPGLTMEERIGTKLFKVGSPQEYMIVIPLVLLLMLKIL